MSFTSTIFLFLFFPLTLAGYYLIRKELKNIFFVIASLLFYTIGDPSSIWLLVFSIAVNYFLGRSMNWNHMGGGKKKANRNREIIHKIALIIGIIFNFGFLLYYKYLAFSIQTINSIFSIEFTIPIINLPLGISFFTFRSISYLLDIYWQIAPPQKNIFDTALYISFFPQVAMGPITKYSDFLEQIHDRKFDFSVFAEGIRQIILGLFKKVVFANCLSTMVDFVFSMAHSQRPILLAWMGILGYLLQLYYDFSGYSDMAIGIGKLFGFKTPINFDYPYFANSVAEYWNKWHMTLGNWLKDYIYTPIFRNMQKRKYPIQRCNIIALFFTWLFSGLWHGAAWHFVAMGMYYFLFIAMERTVEEKQKLRRKKLGLKKQQKTWHYILLSHIYLILVVIFGQILFRINSLSDFFPYVGSMLGLMGNRFAVAPTWFYWSQNSVLMIVGWIFAFPIMRPLERRFNNNNLLKQIYLVVSTFAYGCLAIVAISFVFTDTYQAFIYNMF